MTLFFLKITNRNTDPSLSRFRNEFVADRDIHQPNSDTLINDITSRQPLVQAAVLLEITPFLRPLPLLRLFPLRLAGRFHGHARQFFASYTRVRRPAVHDELDPKD